MVLTPTHRLTLSSMSKSAFTPLLLLLGIWLLAACGPSKDKARFEGKLENISDAEFYAYTDDGTSDRFDTIRITDGSFVYERKLSGPVLLTLLYPNFTQSYVILQPGKTVKMRGDASKIGEASITGTEDNELLTDFNHANASVSENNRRMAAAEFVRSHASSLAAVAVFRKYFAQVEQPDARKALPLLDELLKAQPQSQGLRYLDAYLRPILKAGTGQPMPQFTASTLDGKTVSTKDFAGQPYVVVSFASWNSKSVAFLRQLKSLLRETGMRPWRCLLLSVDVDAKQCRDALRQDSISWPVVCDEQAFRSQLIRQLGANRVPSCFLVNAQGRIIARDIVDIDQLRQKLRQ